MCGLHRMLFAVRAILAGDADRLAVFLTTNGCLWSEYA